MATQILILGGGFGGAFTARHLEQQLQRDPDVQITLVSRDNFVLFTPMLHEVAASDIDLTHIVTPMRKLLRRTQFVNADVQSIDLNARRVVVSHGSDRHTHELPYDHLVIAMGSVTNLAITPGAAVHALTMRTLGDAMRLRNRLIAALEEADAECASAVRRSVMSFVVVGGGFAGVETIGAINDFVHESLRYYPRIRPDDIRMTLVHAGSTLLPELSPKLGTYTQRKLVKQGVEVITSDVVAQVQPHRVVLKSGREIDTRHVIWTVGNTTNPILADLPCAKQNGRLCVNEMLQLQGASNVWALGDCALIPDRDTGRFHPPTAQHAIREAKIAAHNVAAAIHGGKPRPFRFRTLGQLAAIGRRAGVAQILGLRFSGLVAWMLWRAIYLSKLPGLDRKCRVAIDWTLDLFFSKDLVQYGSPTETSEQAQMAESNAPVAGSVAVEPAHAA